MKGKIFMSQEKKVINVALAKRNEIDQMIFKFENECNVNLNDESGQNDLKIVFSQLLKELIDGPIELKYIEDDIYDVNLYKDVCKEYIKDLNREVEEIRNLIPEKLSALFS